jgi:hypothetical protein
MESLPNAKMRYNPLRQLRGLDSNIATSCGMPESVEVDPGELHLPPTRSHGADPFKLARQIAKHGDSLNGMPPGSAEIIQNLPQVDFTRMPKVKETQP